MAIEFTGKKLYTSQDKPEAKREVKGKVSVIKGGLLIDGNGGKPVRNPVVVLEGSTIKEIGVDGQVNVPADAEMIDCSKLTLMPGLMDLHIHTPINNTIT
jgi:imidazolonepropionase-like amidohydrolase